MEVALEGVCCEEGVQVRIVSLASLFSKTGTFFEAFQEKIMVSNHEGREKIPRQEEGRRKKWEKVVRRKVVKVLVIVPVTHSGWVEVFFVS